MNQFPTQENNAKGKQIKTWQIQQKKMNKYDKNDFFPNGCQIIANESQ